MLFKTDAAKNIDPMQLITHDFALDDILAAHDTFSDTAKAKALKVIITACPSACPTGRPETTIQHQGMRNAGVPSGGAYHINCLQEAGARILRFGMCGSIASFYINK